MSVINSDEWHELSDQINQGLKAIEQEQETYWNSLTKDQQLMVFCAVVRRIVDGEIKERGSYRYVLYNVFGFGAEAYIQAQDAGYLALHNAFWVDNGNT